jgi:ankyrin repeat protein
MKWIKSYMQIINESEETYDLNKELIRAVNGVTYTNSANPDLEYKKMENLLDSGADPNTRYKSIEDTPLHQLVKPGREKYLKLFLDKGADPNARDKHLETPLHRALEYDNMNAMQILINSGADIRVENIQGKGLIDYAMRMRDPSIRMVKFLIDNGADPNAVSNKGVSCLESAISIYKRGGEDSNSYLLKPIAKLLIEKGADPSKAFSTLREFSMFFGQDISWYPGGMEDLEKKFKAKEIRKKLF